MNRYKTLLLGTALAVPFASAVLASAAPNNLIHNGSFDSDVAGWDNYGGNPTLYKNHMKLTNSSANAGSSYAGAWTCVKVKPETSYATAAEYWVPESAPANTGASLQLHYYSSNNCSGPLLESGAYREGGKLPAQRGEWQEFSFKEKTPDGAHSVRVRASAIKEPPGGGTIPGTHIVYFDNVSFVEQLKLVAQPTSTPKGPGDIVAQPTWTPTPKGPGDIVAQPTATATPKGPDDLVSNPDPTATPGAPDTGDDQDGPSDDAPGGSNNGDNGQGGAGANNGVDVLAHGKPNSGADSGNEAEDQDVSGVKVDEGGSVGLGLAMLFLAAGSVCAAIGLGVAGLAKRRRNEEE